MKHIKALINSTPNNQYTEMYVVFSDAAKLYTAVVSLSASYLHVLNNPT